MEYVVVYRDFTWLRDFGRRGSRLQKAGGHDPQSNAPERRWADSQEF